MDSSPCHALGVFLLLLCVIHFAYQLRQRTFHTLLRLTCSVLRVSAFSFLQNDSVPVIKQMKVFSPLYHFAADKNYPFHHPFPSMCSVCQFQGFPAQISPANDNEIVWRRSSKRIKAEWNYFNKATACFEFWSCAVLGYADRSPNAIRRGPPLVFPYRSIFS